MELRACPVRLLTPDVKAWLSLFDLTHEVRRGEGRAYFTRVAFPASGGVDDQPARTIEALNVIRVVRNALLVERAQPVGAA
jgi:hypothetical protein